jgi:hypothetical protein
MSHEMSKAHQQQVAEKAAIIANTAFKLGRKSELDRVLEVLKDELSEEHYKDIETKILGGYGA